MEPSMLHEVDLEDLGAMRRLAHAHEGDDSDPGSSDVKRRKKKSRPEEFHKVGGKILAMPYGMRGRSASWCGQQGHAACGQGHAGVGRAMQHVCRWGFSGLGFKVC